MNIFILFLFLLFLGKSLSFPSLFNGTIEDKQLIPPPINGSFILDPQNELLIGPPTDIEKPIPNFWMIFAYTLDVLLIFILAVFFRIHYIRNGNKLEGWNTPSS